MPILENSRHERFAQELAQGKAIGDAYVAAGYKPSPASATRLSKNINIQDRVADLKTRASDGVVLNRQWVLERLMRNARIAMGEEKIKVAIRPRGTDGKLLDATIELEITDRDVTGANRALELLGKELGMFVDRSEVDLTMRSHEQALEELEQEAHADGTRVH